MEEDHCANAALGPAVYKLCVPGCYRARTLRLVSALHYSRALARHQALQPEETMRLSLVAELLSVSKSLCRTGHIASLPLAHERDGR